MDAKSGYPAWSHSLGTARWRQMGRPERLRNRVQLCSREAHLTLREPEPMPAPPCPVGLISCTIL
jgi:hypothetical protein